MANKKCHHCGIVDSTHISDYGRSKLVEAVGPTDHDGLQIWLVYCRACKHMNIYKPGWFGNMKHSKTWSSLQIIMHYPSLRRDSENHNVIGITKSAQSEMLKNLDAVLYDDDVVI
jgi:hypothetical protein